MLCMLNELLINKTEEQELGKLFVFSIDVNNF